MEIPLDKSISNDELRAALLANPGKRSIVVKGIRLFQLKPFGTKFWFEYHCYEGHDSADAELWYRSHQRVEVVDLAGMEPIGFTTHKERAENGLVLGYTVRFSDGKTFDVFEDELLHSRSQFVRPHPPRRPTDTANAPRTG